jgi:demethylmenaquinone methyltransferase/2-methoxy-6-polyprenyl-1,4-benzoquinol methylase
MFSGIARRYDFLNRLLSLDQDRRWRKIAVDQLLGVRRAAESPARRGLYLDACAGTLGLAREMARRGAPAPEQVIACDFALPMLQQGPAAIGRLGIVRVCADTLRLPFGDGTFDGATVGFGVRNLASISAGLEELARVVKPGARLVILEFATPTWQPFRAIYLFYFLRVLPWIGRRISRHETAYAYLPASVLAFPAPAELARAIEAAGFERAHWRLLSGGIVAVHTAERRNSRRATGSALHGLAG